MEIMQATSCSNVVVKPFSASSKSAALAKGLTAFRIRRTAKPISKGFFSMERTSIEEWRRQTHYTHWLFRSLISGGRSLADCGGNQHVCHIKGVLISRHGAAFACDWLDILVAIHIHTCSYLVRHGNRLTDQRSSFRARRVFENGN